MTVHTNQPRQNQDLSYPGKPEQLKLFMSGTEWQNDVTHSTDGPVDKVWPEKESQARAPRSPHVHGSGTYDSIKRSGYQSYLGDDTPTIVFETNMKETKLQRVQSQGHHRVAAAAALERDTGNPVYLPTNYVDNTPGARMRAREARARQEARGLA